MPERRGEGANVDIRWPAVTGDTQVIRAGIPLYEILPLNYGELSTKLAPRILCDWASVVNYSYDALAV
jgi:hypothetical protein